jgi:hypothetical protein
MAKNGTKNTASDAESLLVSFSMVRWNIFVICVIAADTVSTVFVLHYWTPSSGPSTDGPSRQAASGVDR